MFTQHALDQCFQAVDGAKVVPLDRWDIAVEEKNLGQAPIRFSMFLDNVSGFDHALFGLSENEAAIIDPQHRLLLECSYETLKQTGLKSNEFASSGVFVVRTA